MRARRKTLMGRVVSNKMSKTVVVAVESFRQHPLYQKTLRRLSRFKVHDEKNECRLGDLVRIIESRPLSKEKHWVVAEVLERGEVAEIQPTEIGSSDLGQSVA